MLTILASLEEIPTPIESAIIFFIVKLLFSPAEMALSFIFLKILLFKFTSEPEKSTPSPFIWLKKEFLISPVEKSLSNASEEAFEKFVFEIKKLEWTIFRKSSAEVFVKLVLSISTLDL